MLGGRDAPLVRLRGERDKRGVSSKFRVQSSEFKVPSSKFKVLKNRCRSFNLTATRLSVFLTMKDMNLHETNTIKIRDENVEGVS